MSIKLYFIMSEYAGTRPGILPMKTVSPLSLSSCLLLSCAVEQLTQSGLEPNGGLTLVLTIPSNRAGTLIHTSIGCRR